MPSPWWRGEVEGLTVGAETLLVHARGGALSVRAGRLRPRNDYGNAPRPARQELARVGAMVRLRALGRFHLHAGGVVAPDGGAWLLVGASGSGKSTLTYALARAGWPVLGDDGVVLERGAGGGAVMVHAWHEPMRVGIDLARWFPELGERRGHVDPDDPRHRVPVVTCRARRARAAGMLILARGRTDALTPLPPTAALAAVIPQSAMVLLNDGHAAAHLETLRALVERAPVFRLVHTERQLHRIARTIGEAVA